MFIFILPIDILKLIVGYLPNYDKISFIISNKKLLSLVKHFKMTSEIFICNSFVYVSKCPKLRQYNKNIFYDQSTNFNIMNNENNIRLPLSVEKLKISYDIFTLNNPEYSSGDPLLNLRILSIKCGLNNLSFDKFKFLTELKIRNVSNIIIPYDSIPKTVITLNVEIFNLDNVEHLFELKLISLSVHTKIVYFDRILKFIPLTVKKLYLHVTQNLHCRQIDLNNLTNEIIEDFSLEFNVDIGTKIIGKIKATKCKLINVSEINDIIPDNVKHLTLYMGSINNYVDYPMVKIFPTLTSLIIHCYKFPIKIMLNYGLKYLETYVDNYDLDNIPSTLLHLSIRGPPQISDRIPKTITYLTLFGDCYYNDLGKFVSVENYYENLIDAIPDSVTHLTLGKYFCQDLTNVIGDNITHLVVNKNFNHEINHKILNKVKFLTIPKRYEKNLNKENLVITWIF